jgi:hypothetical protein
MTEPEDFLRSSFERAKREHEATAFHEGGHVAGAWAWGVPIRGPVTIAPNLRCWGSAVIGKRFSQETVLEVLSGAALGKAIPPKPRQDLEAHILVLYAGRLAEARAVRDGEATADPLPTDPLEREWLPRRLLMERLALGDAREAAGLPRWPPSDDDQAAEILRTLSAGRVEEANAYGAWLWERAVRMVEGDELFWTVARAVAGTLLGVETLSATATRRVVRAALRPEVTPEFSNYIGEPKEAKHG